MKMKSGGSWTHFERIQICEKILQNAQKELAAEIDHWLNLDREYEYDVVSAIFDIETRAEEWVADGDNRHKPLLDEVRKILIEIGFYRPMTQEEIENTYVSNGHSPWNFKLNEVAYTADETVEEWQFP